LFAAKALRLYECAAAATASPKYRVRLLSLSKPSTKELPAHQAELAGAAVQRAGRKMLVCFEGFN
jgi:hypothetical protein